MNIRTATLDDYKELCAMYKELLIDTYEGFELGKDIFIDGTVQQWFKSGYDMVISETEEGEVTGFTMAYVENIGIVEPYYYGSLAYVKPKHRRGRSAYMLYNNVVDYAESKGLPVIAKAYIGNGNKNKIDKIQSRWGNPIFTEYTSKTKEK